MRLTRRQLRRLIYEAVGAENNSAIADKLKKKLDSTGNFGSDSGIKVTLLKDGRTGLDPVLRTVTQVLGDPFLHIAIDTPKDLKSMAKSQLKKMGLSFYGVLDKLVNNIQNFEDENKVKFAWVATNEDDDKNIYVFHASEDGTLPSEAEYFENFTYS